MENKQQQETKKKVIGYARLSSEEQAKGASIDDQRQRIEQYCIIHNLELIDVVKEIHSSKEGKLKQLKDTVANIINNDSLYGLVVAYTNRLGRDDILPRTVVRDLHKVKKQLYCCDVEADLRTPAGYSLFSILVMMANFENLNKGQVVKNVLETIRKEERRITFKPWFGYCFDENKHLKIHPFNAKSIKQIFELTASGLSPSTICNQIMLEKNGKQTPIPLTTYYRIIKNKVYYEGKYYFKSELIEFEPIISKETWENANKKHHSKKL